MQITPVNPPRCSSCFQQRTDLRHVDFGAAWDGPVIDESTGDEIAFSRRTTIDLVIVCEKCLTDAGRLVGLAPDGEAQEEITRLEERQREISGRLDEALQHIATLEAAAASRGRLEDRLVPATTGRSGRARKQTAKAAA